MGWLRLVGSLKLQVSFAEYHLFYRALLQKRPTILRSLQVVATPYYVLYATHCNPPPHTTLQHSTATHCNAVPVADGFDLYKCNYGVAQIVGSLKLKVSFAECHLFYRALLQKRPVADGFDLFKCHYHVLNELPCPFCTRRHCRVHS